MGSHLKRLRARTSKSGRTSYYFDAGGSPRRWIALGANEAIALRRYRELMQAPATGTVDAMLKDALESLRGKVRLGTLRNYASYRKHLAAVFSDPAAITQADVLRYLRLCPRLTFRNEVAFLSAGFALWMDRGLLDFNPCFGVKIRRPGAKRTRLLSDSEISAILDAAPERVAVAVELSYATGLRIGDICRLKWSDIGGSFVTQKTGSVARFEPSDVLDPILARARALQARVASLYVLCNSRGGQWRPDSLRDHWKAACRTAGVENARWHDLRAAAATAIERSFGTAAAQAFLTHRSMVTTQTYLRDRRATVIVPLRRGNAD